ncbi:baseplate wedge tail fiber protein connector [Acinetobacter phage vB_AbaM_Konradin]|uniref:Base plate wedge completion and tail fiber socket protein n=11 Tax=Lazarusvirus TaxID=2842820 RepID=A0A4Y1NKF6_9CAUD|nr:baseplate wedge tail fiber protein connector [Acinetobacter phage vB_ApiM_fHyAci03]YP_009881538.1 baseplate wedge tail fiber protein connector [Acinetobacter phage KARL-1]YP_009885346.1 baseplate wedge tail fiber protein connector [Acinetobacter phage vB_AbaM_Konradin]YP_009886191.1 baseplate wedge tail fiber protein connector [Acinetobacter phage vB_AbaM_Berthold]YP_009886437.1 baseplate wedge tail fiber protein connector [Acinetobacter phage vB_AbaM_Apostate]YP_009886687.1 baseplate wedge
MFIQQPKMEIDVGEIGNASTGDILFDGGEKINSNFTAIYNQFGDQRMYNANTQVGNQTIHATGYYQKVSGIDLRSAVTLGSMWDIDTNPTGGANPILPKGKPGECVKFINSNGSCSVNQPIDIQVIDGSFVGIQGGLKITQPYCMVDCWCIAVNNNIAIWNYSIKSMFGSFETPVEVTKSVPANTPTEIPIAHFSEYNSLKLLITAQTQNGEISRQSEVNILIDRYLKNVHHTEFGVIRIGNKSEEDEIVDIKYNISSAGVLTCTVSTKINNMRVAIKSIATQRLGSA